MICIFLIITSPSAAILFKIKVPFHEEVLEAKYSGDLK